MGNALHRHDITDRAWELISSHLPGKLHDRGGTARITGSSSMPSYGYCAQVVHGAIYRQYMAVGKTLIADSVDGEIKAFGSSCLGPAQNGTEIRSIMLHRQ